MSTVSRNKVYAAAVLVVCLALLVPVALAQEPSAEVRIVGVVDSVEGTLVVIAGQTFDLAGAEVEGAITVGALVEIEAEATNEAGVWLASDVEAVEPEAEEAEADEFVLTGAIEEIGDGYIVIAGQVISMEDLELETALEVGVEVTVEIRLVSGEWVASEIEAAEEAEEPEDEALDCSTAPEGWTTYTIQSGDTLSAIAGASDGDFDEIVENNCIADAGMIATGMTIFVPDSIDADDVDEVSTALDEDEDLDDEHEDEDNEEEDLDEDEDLDDEHEIEEAEEDVQAEDNE